MTNAVVLSGKIVELFDMTEGIKLAKLDCNDESFYIYWEEDGLYTGDVEKCFVCVYGYLTHIKYKREDRGNSFRILAVCVQHMEKINF